MSGADRTKWDARHAADSAAPPRPRGLLELAAPWLPSSGRALDVACGRGYDTAELAARGLDVVATDVSPVGLELTRSRAAARGVAARVTTVEADLDDGLPAVGGTFDVVICRHFHAPELWPALRAALRPGGLLLLETATTRNAELGLGGPGARYVLAPGAIVGAAQGMDVLACDEGVFETVHVARLVARRRTIGNA